MVITNKKTHKKIDKLSINDRNLDRHFSFKPCSMANNKSIYTFCLLHTKKTILHDDWSKRNQNEKISNHRNCQDETQFMKFVILKRWIPEFATASEFRTPIRSDDAWSSVGIAYQIRNLADNSELFRHPIFFRRSDSIGIGRHWKRNWLRIGHRRTQKIASVASSAFSFFSFHWVCTIDECQFNFGNDWRHYKVF